MLSFVTVSPPPNVSTNLDAEASELFRQKLEKQFSHLKCLYHPEYNSKVAAIVEDGEEAVVPVDFCCSKFEERFRLSYLEHYNHKRR